VSARSCTFASGLYLMASLDHNLPYSMKAAMYSGLLSSHLVRLPDPPFECTSGNCTWDPFLTLGVETLCTNHTDLVMLACSKDDMTCYEGNRPFNCTNYGCALKSKGNGSFAYILDSTTNTTQMVIQASKSSYMKLDPIRSKNFANITGLLGTVSWAKITKAVVSQNTGEFSTPIRTLWPNSTFEAFTCGIYMTVMEVQPNVTAGLYHEKVINSFPQVDNSSQTPTEKWAGIDFYYHIPEDSDDIVYRPNPSIRSSEDQTELRVSGAAFEILASQLISPDLLQGDVGTGSSESVPRGSTDMATMLYRAANMTKAIETMAKFMTIALRSNDSLPLQDAEHNASIVAPTHIVYGQMHVEVLFVRVGWVWLALPIAMLGFSVFFIATTMLRTWDGPVGLWKESPLALFFHAAVGDSFCQVQDELRSDRKDMLDTVDCIETAATQLEARVVKDSGGSTLLEVCIREGDVLREKLKHEVAVRHADELDFLNGPPIPSIELRQTATPE
jgi:hypothetical protein